jgi:hypothetical protein
MSIYRKSVILDDPGRVVISDLPFPPGTRVTISVEEERKPSSERGRKWLELFGEIDASEEVRRLSPDEVAEEIAAYRKRS